MPATLKFDATVFNRTLKQYLSVSSLTITQAMNKKGLDLVIATTSLTKKASAADIRAAVGPTGSRLLAQKVRITKKGIKRGKHASEAVYPTLTIALAIDRLGSEAVGPDRWTKILQMARKIFSARMRSIGFIKHGWLGAREVLKRSDRGGDPPALSDVLNAALGRRGASVKAGGAEPARRGFKPTVTIWNAVADAPHAGPGALKYGREGLQAGFDRVTADMLQYIDRKMGRDAKQFNAAQRRR